MFIDLSKRSRAGYPQVPSFASLRISVIDTTTPIPKAPSLPHIRISGKIES